MVYVVQNKYHSRVHEEGEVERFEVGEAIEPTEQELAAFPDRFRRIPEPVTRTPRKQAAEGQGDAT